MHLNRKNIGKFWAVPRKGTKYVAISTHNQRESMPLIVIMRDVLKVVRNKKELKKAINEKQIKINGKEIKEVNYPVSLFDVLSIEKKNYKAILSEHKKMVFEEVSGEEAETKVFKVLGRKILFGKKVQLNLMHGKNIISEEKVNIGDSVVLNFKDNKIMKVVSIEKGRDVFVYKGKHAGIKGKIDGVIERGGKKLAKIVSKDKRINVWTESVIVV